MPHSVRPQPIQTLSLKKERYAQMLGKANHLGAKGFEKWLFCPGMQFNSMQKWWGDHGQRDFPHEGIDLCLYKNRSMRTCRIDENFRIPVIYDGVIQAIFSDYLGKAVIVEHKNILNDNCKLLSIYAHTNPRTGIQIGEKVNQGDIIATLADTRASTANIIPHLHFSLGLPSPHLSYDALIWNVFRNPDKITLLDPLDLIDLPYQELDPDVPYCLGL